MFVLTAIGIKGPTKPAIQNLNIFLKNIFLKNIKHEKNIILKERKKLKFANFLGHRRQTQCQHLKKIQKHKKKINLK
jgi:hypothetical protein